MSDGLDARPASLSTFESRQCLICVFPVRGDTSHRANGLNLRPDSHPARYQHWPQRLTGGVSVQPARPAWHTGCTTGRATWDVSALRHTSTVRQQRTGAAKAPPVPTADRSECRVELSGPPSSPTSLLPLDMALPACRLRSYDETRHHHHQLRTVITRPDLARCQRPRASRRTPRSGDGTQPKTTAESAADRRIVVRQPTVPANMTSAVTLWLAEHRYPAHTAIIRCDDGDELLGRDGCSSAPRDQRDGAGNASAPPQPRSRSDTATTNVADGQNLFERRRPPQSLFSCAAEPKPAPPRRTRRYRHAHLFPACGIQSSCSTTRQTFALPAWHEARPSARRAGDMRRLR